eukprot:scaffold153_cov347-Pavlova_lutheri.AAC.16
MPWMDKLKTSASVAKTRANRKYRNSEYEVREKENTTQWAPARIRQPRLATSVRETLRNGKRSVERTDGGANPRVGRPDVPKRLAGVRYRRRRSTTMGKGGSVPIKRAYSTCWYPRGTTFRRVDGKRRSSWRRAHGQGTSDEMHGLTGCSHFNKQELDVTIVKATSEEESPPKEKHVRSILSIVYMDRQEGEHEHVLHKLGNRIRGTKSWIVVLKTLNVYHRILQTCSARARQQFLLYSRASGVLDLRESNDQRATMSWELSAFTRAYAEYLEERISSFKELHFDVASPDSLEDVQDLGIDELLEVLPKMQIILRKVLGCKPDMYAGVNFAMLTPLQLVVEESFQVYACTSQAILRIVDSYFQLCRTDCLLAIDIYRTAIAQSRALQQYYSELSQTSMKTEVRFPNIEIPPIDFLDTMEDHVQQMRQMRHQPKAQESAGGPWAAYPTLERASSTGARPARTKSAPMERSSGAVVSGRKLRGHTSREDAMDALALPAPRAKSGRNARESNVPALPEPSKGSKKALPARSANALDTSSRKSLSRTSSTASRERLQLPSTEDLAKRGASTRIRSQDRSTMAQLESLEDGMTALAVRKPAKDSRILPSGRSISRRQSTGNPETERRVLSRSHSSNATPVSSQSRSLVPAKNGQANAGVSNSGRPSRGPSAAVETSQERKLVVAGRGRARAAQGEEQGSNAIVTRSKSRPTEERGHAEVPSHVGYGYNPGQAHHPRGYSNNY